MNYDLTINIICNFINMPYHRISFDYCILNLSAGITYIFSFDLILDAIKGENKQNEIRKTLNTRNTYFVTLYRTRYENCL